MDALDGATLDQSTEGSLAFATNDIVHVGIGKNFLGHGCSVNAADDHLPVRVDSLGKLGDSMGSRDLGSDGCDTDEPRLIAPNALLDHREVELFSVHIQNADLESSLLGVGRHVQ